MNLINIAAIAIFLTLCLTEVYCNPDFKNWYEDEEAFEHEDCVLPIRGKSALKMPVVYAKNGTRSYFLYPDAEGLLVLKYNFTFKLLCARSRFADPRLDGVSEVEVTCMLDRELLYNGYPYKYEQFECESMPKSELVVTDKTCQSKHTVVSVGFRALEELVVLYNVCFDMETKNALYTWYDARLPYHNMTQVYHKRPPFIKSKELYGKTDVNKLYTVKEQRKTIAKILNSEKQANKFIRSDSEHSLSRGHFAAKADFYYAYEQIATFYYANVAPQWQIFNGRKWAQLEKEYRNMLDDDEDIHVVVTGTYGLCTLPDEENVEHALYLDPPNNIPVPLFYWKLMYDMITDKGIVYLGLNNPYKVGDNSTFMCENVCPGGFKDARRVEDEEDDEESNIFCCTVESFEAVYGKLDPIIFEH